MSHRERQPMAMVYLHCPFRITAALAAALTTRVATPRTVLSVVGPAFVADVAEMASSAAGITVAVVVVAGTDCGAVLGLSTTGRLANPTSTSSSSSTRTGVPKPTQTQDGIDPGCNKFVRAKSGDSCWALANGAGIESAQLYKWNTVLGANGEDCGTQIWPDYYYCVGVSGSGPDHNHGGPSIAEADAGGLPVELQEAKTGASCWALANDNGIDVARLYELNPVLGANGETCGTQIWPDYYYCLEVLKLVEQS
ncbi:hypothetical protein PG993_011375 [Apiospora rasikravindrae]|uniref:LysM domain-containing protein n=1 Tax=Apiospora rasikravindrae TaxID=990691 RepID=A0ABR1SE19_9PEZI